MFFRLKEWTINTNQITYIFHHDDGSIEIYFVDGKKISLEANDARQFLERLTGMRDLK
jgi:hypothetical protein